MFSFGFQSPGIKYNRDCILDFLGKTCIFVNLHAFISLKNSGGVFSKVIQQPFLPKLVKDHNAQKKLVKDHNAPERGLVT